MSNAFLSGPTTGPCGVASADLAISLDAAMGIPAVFTVTSSVVGETITPSTVSIPAGSVTAVFKVTPTTCAARTITISSSTPGVTIAIGTHSYTGECACPDDTAGTARSVTFARGSVSCPPAASLSFSLTPSTTPAIDLYCSTPASIVITE